MAEIWSGCKLLEGEVCVEEWFSGASSCSEEVCKGFVRSVLPISPIRGIRTRVPTLLVVQLLGMGCIPAALGLV